MNTLPQTADLNTLAERLVEARKKTGLTQEEVADRLGCSRPTFIAIEKGTRRPKSSELLQLASIYGVPLSVLLRSDPLPRDIRPHLRGLLDGDDEDQEDLKKAIETLTGFVDDYQALERIVGSKPFTNFPPPVPMSGGPVSRFAEDCAQEQRSRLKLGDQPVLQLRGLLEDEVGVRIFVSPLGRSIAGLYVFVQNFGHCILVNANHRRTRRRWTIAHEYGHFLIDRDKPGVDYVKPTQRKPLNERFADSFASEFLMPKTGVRRHFFEIVNRSGDFKVGDLCWLADLYDVSFAAMTLRLEMLDLVAKGTWEELTKSRVKPTQVRKELGLVEPEDRDVVEAFPERYRLLAVRAFLEGVISEGQLARFLRCDRLEARAAVAQCSLTAGDDQESVTLPLAKSVLSERDVLNA